jgi:hypothetical protein
MVASSEARRVQIDNPVWRLGEGPDDEFAHPADDAATVGRLSHRGHTTEQQPEVEQSVAAASRQQTAVAVDGMMCHDFRIDVMLFAEGAQLNER